MINFTPSSEQFAAIKAVSTWMKDKNRKPYFKLFGYAGTGKTTLAKLFAENINGTVLYAAFTGKAAMVLRNKGCTNATTIHSLIYSVIEDKKTGAVDWVLNLDSALSKAKLLIVDEVSMVNENLARDLLWFEVPVLVLGDPAQLPPVESEGYFINGKPDFMLTEVHRQAKENPIINLSMKVRNNEKLSIGSYGSSKILKHDDVELETLLSMDQLIVGLNKSRNIYNSNIRKIKNFESEVPMVNEKLICLKNETKTGMLNGGIWYVDEIIKDYKQTMTLKIHTEDDYGGEKVKSIYTHKNFFKGDPNSIDWRERKRYSEFDYAYAITCHKSQGSQFPRVMILDESSFFRENRSKWLYTAITRASESVYVVV